MCCTLGFSQSINFDQLGKEKWLRYNGGVSANAVYYDGTANRQELTYYLTGSLNFNIAGVYNVPLSFTYSNQEFNFPNPFNFNRLSLHPSYKWATAHIGDVSMTFSPYTLAGHQFTGGGFDLNPEGKFQISAMYGHFLKATEYNEEHPEALTAYKRMGYGIKTAYDFDFMKLGLILFKAHDEENSLENPFPVELGLSPKDNAVLSFESEFRLFEKASIHIEYAISGVTEDTRPTEAPSSPGLLSFLLKENISTQYYKALNASLDYPAGNGTLGLGYERIDPEYKTLGAYYFNNDLENITVNASQSVFDNKLNLSVNAGLQRDNLNKAKSSDQQRIVSAINANYTASDRLGFNASYSNFQSYTNIRDQFDYINQVGAYDNIDTLNYRQISQNANLGINYILKKTETKQHSTNLNLVYQNSTNQQEGETIEGGENSFYNGMAGYTLGYPKQALNISLAANVSYNTVAEDDNMTLGPTLSIGKQFFDKQLRTNFSSSYNTSYANGEQQNNILNFRLGSNYTLYKKHNLSLNFLMLFRNSELNTGRDLTITFGYSYAFDNFKLDLDSHRRSPNERDPRNRESTLSFRYRNVSYSGTIPQLNEQLTNVYESPQFADIPQFKKDELKILLATVKEQKREEKYKEQALIFLEELYAFDDFKTIYDEALYNVVMAIKDDMKKVDMALEKLFVAKKLEADEHPLNGKGPENYTEKDKTLVPEYEALLKERETRLRKLVGHRWMETQFAAFTSKEKIAKGIGFLLEFKKKQALKSFELYEKTENQEKLEYYLENEIIDFYYKKSLKTVNPELFELRYINKL
ncbi:TonB-dependent receptor [Pseudozobellia thermophila]|uniref:Uncharacterized protein n=1 Tax=Pseudozobellia thermophila TaxID=192903 RepID=A0A1M6AQB3_9FLAO|nr:hypothetical protein [Pseudozobellia thermophila]SHI38587.1 hypothetical protein SAMN04488513_101143 [Pseudozobellia thermophila]